MSNRAILILVIVMIAAAGYLLVKSDGNVDMGGEKHGAEAAHMEEAKKEAPAAPATAPAAPAAQEPAKK